MSQTINATFEDGVLKPSQPLQLPAHAHVRITIEVIDQDTERQSEEKLAALEDLWQGSRVHAGERLTRDQLHERR
jgi:predicted DNA-binding antitoxin AbrB/MazE fold protein